MELKQMQYLIAAVDNKSLNKAAEMLYTTQPNVSKVIKNLENYSLKNFHLKRVFYLKLVIFPMLLKVGV
jgi:DNA-binding MarR family transcriptional regulator